MRLGPEQLNDKGVLERLLMKFVIEMDKSK